jgi:hypothetical protein
MEILSGAQIVESSKYDAGVGLGGVAVTARAAIVVESPCVS